MKRTISALLIAAVLLSLLGVSVFAETTQTIRIEFTIPSVGDVAPSAGTTIISDSAATCTVQAVYTGESINTIVNLNSVDAIGQYQNESDKCEKYENVQPYLILLYVASSGIDLRESPTITLNDNVVGKTMAAIANGNEYYGYAYFTFTPTAATSDSGTNTDGTSENTTTLPVSENHNVTVNYDESVATKTVYSFEVTWGAMSFTYTPATEGTWNPATHQYNSPTKAGWSSTTNLITIENHSNAAITASFRYDAADGFTDISGTFANEEGTSYTDNQVTIKSAVSTSTETPPSASVYLILDGSLAKNTLDGTKSGTVTVTIQ